MRMLRAPPLMLSDAFIWHGATLRLSRAKVARNQRRASASALFIVMRSASLRLRIQPPRSAKSLCRGVCCICGEGSRRHVLEKALLSLASRL